MLRCEKRKHSLLLHKCVFKRSPNPKNKALPWTTAPLWHCTVSHCVLSLLLTPMGQLCSQSQQEAGPQWQQQDTAGAKTVPTSQGEVVNGRALPKGQNERDCKRSNPLSKCQIVVSNILRSFWLGLWEHCHQYVCIGLHLCKHSPCSSVIPLTLHCPVASHSDPACLHMTSNIPDRCVTARCSAVSLAGCLTSSH